MEKEKAIDIVKKKLWTFGYQVKDVRYIFSEPINYDLVVEGKYKVQVFVKKQTPARGMTAAIVGKKINYIFWQGKELKETNSPTKAFIKVEN